MFIQSSIGLFILSKSGISKTILYMSKNYSDVNVTSNDYIYLFLIPRFLPSLIFKYVGMSRYNDIQKLCLITKLD